MKHQMTQRLLLGLLLFITNTFAGIAQADQVLTFGHSETIQSKVLNETRTIFVSLPEGYEQATDRRYPVLYTLDGRTHFKHVVGTVQWLSRQASVLPDTIVVAITNTDRFRDMTASVPAGEEGAAGGANQFLSFIGDELIPYIDKKYRTDGIRTLAGHSMAGMFALHAFLQNQALFQAYIAQSPWIGFDDMAIVKRAERELPRMKSAPVMFFMSLGAEPNLSTAYSRLESAFKNHAPDNLVFHSEHYLEENHMSTPSITLHDALTAQSRFNGWTIPPSIMTKGLKAIKQHVADISKRTGRTVQVPERTLNTMAYALMSQNELPKAVEVLEFAVSQFPQSANLYDSLAEAYDMSGRIKEAVKVLEKGVALAKAQNFRGLEYMTNHLAQIKAKL